MGTVDAAGVFTMFRRAKLMLDSVPDDVLAAAASDGLLVGRLGLTDANGGPLCARVDPRTSPGPPRASSGRSRPSGQASESFLFVAARYAWVGVIGTPLRDRPSCNG